MQNMILYFLNNSSTEERKKIASGLIVLHGGTKNILACSNSPFSAVLKKLYTEETVYGKVDEIGNHKQLKWNPKKPANFYAFAQEYFSRAGLRLEQREMKPPLRGVLYIDENFNVCAENESFEKLEIIGD